MNNYKVYYFINDSGFLFCINCFFVYFMYKDSKILKIYDQISLIIFTIYYLILCQKGNNYNSCNIVLRTPLSSYPIYDNSIAILTKCLSVIIILSFDHKEILFHVINLKTTQVSFYV
ncbi:hypothetical protein EDEG_03871 [Edhazardia aedis USNM 41457]|uniref:Uncharacterized protein n=1 Tax=Edhazardia aedis (strain USNM 41457) TaxID=1003232 RepID=J9D170_EDHAE|nr:hypothetical protein EDEG_03871 [Edhazardia aedis USNM 41457]|eukprot:EJW01571.1 hypothetical protein EDEG_03871 [Edhazardia aedis USNM 41457]